jgi:Flp pilus assembly protein TadG
VSRRRDQRGSALVEITWIGLLLMLPLLWIVLSIFQVQKGAFATSTAVRAAARAYALADNDVAGEQQARAVVHQALADQGVESGAQIDFSCTPYPHDCHSGTSVITVRIETAVDLPLLPDILGGGAPRFALHASETVPIGQFQEVTGAARR